MSRIRGIILMFLGLISLTLGVIGIFVPGLPTTPFVLLASWLFIRSSKKLHIWLLNSYVGKTYINDYIKQGGMTKKNKLYAIIVMCIMIFISCTFFIFNTNIRIIVCFSGLLGTLCILCVVPLAKDISNDSTSDD